MRVTINDANLASIHSLSVGVSKDDVAPVITQIALVREGDALRAIATDRYIVITGLYREVEFQDWSDGEEILIDPKYLKTVVDIRKKDKMDSFTSIHKSPNGNTHALMGGESGGLFIGNLERTFPSVMKLFPTEEPNGSGAMNLRPDFIAKLAKVLPPVARPQRERSWRFEFRSIDGSNKPQPVYAQYSDGDSYKLEALIQPAMMR